MGRVNELKLSPRPQKGDVSPEQIDVKYLGLVAWRYQGYLKALGLAMVGECGEQEHFTDT